MDKIFFGIYSAAKPFKKIVYSRRKQLGCLCQLLLYFYFELLYWGDVIWTHELRRCNLNSWTEKMFFSFRVQCGIRITFFSPCWNQYVISLLPWDRLATGWVLTLSLCCPVLPNYLLLTLYTLTTHTHTHMHACTHTHMHACTHARTHTHTHTRTHACMHGHTCMHTHTHVGS